MVGNKNQEATISGEKKQFTENINLVLTNEQLEKTISNNCCGQEMILEETRELENNKLDLKHTCPKCKKVTWSLETKPPKSVTLNLTTVQYENLLSNIGNILQIIQETKKENH